MMKMNKSSGLPLSRDRCLTSERVSNTNDADVRHRSLLNGSQVIRFRFIANLYSTGFSGYASATIYDIVPTSIIVSLYKCLPIPQ